MLQKIGQMIFFHEKMGDHNFLGLWLVMDDDVKWDATKKLSSFCPSKEKKKTTSVGHFFPCFALWPNPSFLRKRWDDAPTHFGAALYGDFVSCYAHFVHVIDSHDPKSLKGQH